MKRVGVVGLGDMGSGLAKNLIAAGFTTAGFDVSEPRMAAFVELGGQAAASAREVGVDAEAVFVMVMNGEQADSVILGEEGLVRSLKPGSAVILTATIKPSEARDIGRALEGTGIDLIDSPVSGGFAGAQSGTLIMMAAGPHAALTRCQPAMAAVSKAVHRVGDQPGMGQTVKACLQSLIGSIYSATFEAATLAAKAGIKGQVLYDVFSTSAANCVVANTALTNIIDRRFVNTGSHIATMHKDLTIALDLARELGVPLFTASTAMQLFQAGKTRHPDGDNWIVARIITDGISRDLGHALAVMDEFGLDYAELQFLGDKEVGDLDAGERRHARELIRTHGKKVACISRHVFAGMPMSTKAGDELHARHMAGLGRCIEMAHELDCPLVRIMSGRKEMILWGSHGAEHWNVAKGAWDALLPLIEPAVRLAEREGVILVVETGNGTMVHSAYTGRRLCEAIGSDHLKVLWDPANACYGHERAWPEGYDELRGGHLGHLHIKDVQVDTPRAYLEVRKMGEGQLADQFGPLAAALKADAYDGVVSLESVYHRGDGDFEAGFRACIGRFRAIFA